MTSSAGVERLVAALVDAGQRALDHGRFDEAAELAQRVLDEVPDEPTARILLQTARDRGGQGAVDHGRRFLTVMFSDVVGSTELSERLDPEDYLSVIAAYREVVYDAIDRHNGHLDQFQGDGALAYFGFPTADEDDQVRAVEAGLDIVRLVPEAGRRLGIELGSRVGIHVGRTVMTSSELGVRERSTAVGFATNVAARIQGVAEPGMVVVSESALDAVSPFFDITPLGDRTLKGISGAMRVYAVSEARARSTMSDTRYAAPLVGRENETSRIDNAWKLACERSDDGDGSRLVVLTGELGIGKSRLARYAMDLAEGDDAAVIEINCGTALRHVGLGAVRRGIEKALGLASDAKPRDIRATLRERAALVGLSDAATNALEVLIDVVPGEEAPRLAPDALRDAIIDGLLEWVDCEAAHGPVALVVEDMQWADATAVETLRRLTTKPLPAGLMTLMTARVDGMPAELGHVLVNAIDLTPLGDADAVEMVRAFTRHSAVDDAKVAELAQRGEGVPLFTEHLVMAAASGSDRSLPATLEGLLQVRLAATGPGRGAAQLAATIGREFTVDVLERSLVDLGEQAPLTPAALGGALRVLGRAGLIEWDGPRAMRFRHSMVRDVAYEMQLRDERRRRHRAVAHAMVALNGPDASPQSLAYHYENGDELESAAHAYNRAADAAAAMAEFDIALGHCAAASAIIERLGPSARRIELTTCMQRAAISAASFSYARDEAERAYLRALELCDLIVAAEGPDAALDVQVMAALGGLWSKEVVAGDLNAARRVTDRLERLAVSVPPELGPQLRRFILACRGFEFLFNGANAEALRALDEASTMDVGPVAVPLGTPHDYVAAVDALRAVALVLAGDDPGADRALDAAIRRAALLRFPIGPFTEAVVQVYASYVYRLRGDIEAAHAAAARITEIGEQHGFREHAMLGHLLGLAAAVMGNDPASCQALENLLSLWRMAGGGLAVPVLLTELAEGCLRAGEPARARTVLDDAAAMMAQTDQRGCEPEVIRIGGRLDLLDGAAADAAVKTFLVAAETALAGGAPYLAARAIRDAEGCMHDAGEVAEHNVVAVGQRVQAQLGRDVSGS